MKKILLSLASLLIAGGAWAQTEITLTTDVNSPITYVLKSTRPAYGNPDLHYHDNKIRFYQPEVYGTAGEVLAPEEQVRDHDFLFYFTESSNGKFYIHPYVAADANMVYGVETVAANQQIVLVDKNNPEGKIALEWELAAGGSDKKYFQTTVNDVKYCINDGNNRPSYAVLHEVSGTPGNGYVLSFSQKTAPNCNITEAKYATYYAAHTVNIPDGVSAYYVSAINGSSASLTEITGAIPANTGVILYSETPKECAFEIAPYAKAAAIENNYLRGTIDDNAKIQGDAYILSDGGIGVVGLYAVTLTDGKFKNNANKAYMPKPAETPASIRYFNFGGTETAIKNIEGAESNSVVYDLSGRRVQNVTKGLYIVNGKKVVK